MTKLTVRYFIDGKQIDETEIHQPAAAAARELIDFIKDAVGEIVSDLNAPAMGLGLREALARLAEPAGAPEEHSRFNPSHCPYCSQPMPSG